MHGIIDLWGNWARNQGVGQGAEKDYELNLLGSSTV